MSRTYHTFFDSIFIDHCGMKLMNEGANFRSKMIEKKFVKFSLVSLISLFVFQESLYCTLEMLVIK